MGNIGLAEVLAMVLAESAKVSQMIVGKAVMSDGMNNFVLIFYTNTIASLVLFPRSFFFHRSQRPPLTPSILCAFFALALLGFLAQIMLYAGIYYSSPTLGTAMRDIIPGITFLLAVISRNPSAWSLKPYKRLIFVLYAGAFGCAFQMSISAWCLHRTGPVFVAMFKPVGIVIAGTVVVIFLDDASHLGSFIGAAVIVIGFYSVMWGKAKEEKMGMDSGVRNLESSTQKAPLLESDAEEM